MIPECWQWISANSAAIQTISLVAAAIAAFVVIRYNAIISRREATINMVNSQLEEQSDGYQEFKNLIQDIERVKSSVADYAEETVNNKAGRDIILAQLNRYELISLGIKHRVFAERFYKRWFFSQFVRDFDKLTPFIQATRTQYKNVAYFCEYEALAQRWKRKRHPVKHPPRWKIIWWVLTKQLSRASRALASDAI